MCYDYITKRNVQKRRKHKFIIDYGGVFRMSMMEAGSYDNYRIYRPTPSWQKIERYDYCAQSMEKQPGYVDRLYEKLKKLIKA